MERDITKQLLAWKEHPRRKPLIVRGARQVGKTFIIEAFGKKEFTSYFSINFEEAKNFKSCFESMDPRVILREIELISWSKIVPGETLLFLDEIQQCPKALQALRYFKEKLPEQHVIAAGSLLEFAMDDVSFSFPVGRVQFANLFPLSFGEFLDAIGDSALRGELEAFTLDRPPSEAIHTHLLKRLREYFIVGGMPAAILAYQKTDSFLEVKYEQRAILETYERDFAKYAPKTQHRHLRKIFQEASRFIGEHVKYSKIDRELPNPAREIKRAIELLELAGIIHSVLATSAGDVPLLTGLKETIFKLIFLDIGLLEQAMSVGLQFPGLMTGNIAEQYVGQELLANSDPFLDEKLFFWTRQRASAEVDYLVTHKGRVIPIEVKAGKIGKLKSLHIFLEEKGAPLGIKISQEPLQLRNRILSLPLYLVSQLPRLVDALGFLA